MADRILGPQGSKRRKRFLWVPMLLIACIALFVIGSAQAVHDEAVYQLDGNAQVNDNSETPVMPSALEDADNICAGQFAIQGATSGNAKGQFCHPAAGVTLPSATSSTRFAFVTDGSGPFAASQGNVDDQYTGGSGDPNDVSDWVYKNAASSNDKSDIQNAFAAEYTVSNCPSDPAHAGCHNGDRVMYFGGDRTSDSGDENTAFWFLQRPAVESPNGACASPSGCHFTTDGSAWNGIAAGSPGSNLATHTAAHPGADRCLFNPSNPSHSIDFNTGGFCAETAAHAATEGDSYGDILVVSAFTGGGVQPNVTAYEWIGSEPYATASGADKSACGTSACTTIKILSVSTGCSATDSADPACAITNQAVQSGIVGENPQPITSPWVYTEKSSDNGQTGANTCTPAANKMCPSIYFEGGLNLTALGLQSECTSTFVMNTRSSQSVNASLQDLAVGQVGKCTSGIQTTPSITSDTQIPAGGTIPNVTDTAAVDVAGVANWAGTVTFHLCGPDDLTNQTNCKSGGIAIDATNSGAVTNASKNATSAGATITKVGKYCWRANVHFTTPATGVPDGVDPDPNGTSPDSQSECFNITPRTPSLSTHASGPVTLGNPISDTATIGNTANQPGTPVINPTTAGSAAGGSIHWIAYGPNNCTTVAMAETTRPISGDGTYPTNAQAPVSFTPTAEGVYTFVASYDGNSPNTNSVPATACPDTSGTETVVVSSSSVATSPADGSGGIIPASGTESVTDSATVAVNGATTWSGNVRFFLCGPADLQSQTNCKTGGTQIGGDKAVSNGAATASSDSATITSVGKYCWRARFISSTTGVPDSTDPTAGSDSQSECFTITPRQPTLSTQASGPVALGNPISDTATLANTANEPGSPVINPTTAGGKAQGTITIKVFGPDSCTTQAHADFTRNVNGDGTYGPVSFTPAATGQYVFVASYSGDSPNTLGVDATACANQPDTEKVIVASSGISTIPSVVGSTSITTGGSIQVTDQATVNVNGQPTWSGNVRFHLCGPADLPTATSNCSTGGTLIGADKPVSSSTSATTTSDAATITSVGRYCWRGEFLSDTPGVPNSTDPSDTTSQTECFTVTPVTPTLSTQVVDAAVALGSPIQDRATLSGTANEPGSPVINPTTPGGKAQGTITISVFGPDSCANSAHPDFTVNVNGDDTYGPVGFTPIATGTYVFVASYSGDSPNTLGVDATACLNQPDSEKVIVSASSVVTTPSAGSGGIIPAAGTKSVTDSATVTVDGQTSWNGDVRFHLCGPADLPTATSNCSTGGTLIGMDKAVSNGAPTVLSDAATITSVGRYCWRADFLSNTTGVPDSTDPAAASDSQSECFTITPRQPTLTTQVVNASVVIGDPIQDNATLSDTANEPGTPVIDPTTPGGPAHGTITIKVFGPDNCTTPAHADFTLDVNGDGTYGPVSFTPTAIGVYTFVASYSGDAPNTLGVAETACANQPDNEKVTVIGIAHASSVQNWEPNDTVTLTGDSNLNGSLDVTLYPGDSCSAGGQVQPVPNMSFHFDVVNGDKTGVSFSTSNTTFTVDTPGLTTWSWLVHYHDNVQTSPDDSCSEVTHLNITN